MKGRIVSSGRILEFHCRFRWGYFEHTLQASDFQGTTGSQDVATLEALEHFDVGLLRVLLDLLTALDLFTGHWLGVDYSGVRIVVLVRSAVAAQYLVSVLEVHRARLVLIP